MNKWKSPLISYPDPEPKKGRGYKPKDAKPFTWQQVRKLVNKGGYRLTDVAKMHGVTAPAVKQKLNRNGYVYDPKEIRVKKANKEPKCS